VNICKWIYTIQLNYAWKTCVEGEGLGPNRIYCALSITNQRTLKISPASEKAFFQTALTMWDGFFWSQSNSLTALQFAQVSSIYRYFSIYEFKLDSVLD
jgi:hypothetical protein